MLLEIITILIITIISILIVWKGSSILENTSQKLASYYGLPPIVQGVIIAAIGSSFPELSSTVISTIVHGEFQLGVAVITGSAIFNILVIPGLSGLFAKNTMQANRDLVFKETQFYMISVAVFLLILSFGVIYNPLEGEFIKGKITRGMASFSLLFYLVYIFIQYNDTMDYKAEKVENINQRHEWLMLGFSLLIIVIGVEGLVRTALKAEVLFNIPSFLWGLTVIAGGTSIADLFVSVESAKKGREITSIANVLGSNIFDLLVAIPAGILISGSAVINYSRAVPLMTFLIVATFVLFVFIRTSLEITKNEAWALLILYFIFLTWMTLETIGVTSFVL